jgi:hypothetical protein
MRTPAPRRTRSGKVPTRPRARDGTLLAGIGCVLAAMLLYAMAAMLWGVGDDDAIDVEDRRAIGAQLQR